MKDIAIFENFVVRTLKFRMNHLALPSQLVGTLLNYSNADHDFEDLIESVENMII